MSMDTERRQAVEDLLSSREWLKAKELLQAELRECPDDPWVLTRIARTCYELEQSSAAVSFSERAYTISDNNPEVLWDYACSLYSDGRFEESRQMFDKLLRLDTSEFAERMGYKPSWARQIKNACRFKIAQCYLQHDDLAVCKDYLEEYLDNCQRGVTGPYSKEYVKSLQKQISEISEQELSNTQRLWIGLVELREVGDAKSRLGAFTNALVCATSKAEAIRIMADAVRQEGFEMVKAEDTEEYLRRKLKSKVSSQIDGLAELARETGEPQLSEIVTFPLDEKMKRCQEPNK